MVPFYGKYQPLWKSYLSIFSLLSPFSRFSQFKIRDLENVGYRLYKCGGCEYCCTQSRSLAKHELTNSSKRPLKCDDCECKCDEGDTLHVAICQRLRCRSGLKCEWPLICSCRFANSSTAQAVNLLLLSILATSVPFECIFAMAVLVVDDISTGLTSHHWMSCTDIIDIS